MEDRNKPHMTPEGWRCDATHRHLLRIPWVNYRDPGIHLLTMVVAERKPLLGHLSGEEMVLSSLGKKVSEEIKRIPEYEGASAIEICNYVVMPDHIHILLRIHERLPQHLGRYVGWFKLQCADLYKIEKADSSSQPIGDVPPSKIRLFAPEYHARPLTKHGQLQRMIAYIKDNPKRLAMKRANPDLFRIQEEIEYNGMRMRVMGNRFLFDYPDKAVLQCSRSMTQEEIGARKEECLAAAENGTVFVSAAISEGEKQICRALREGGYPIIILLAEGFPKEGHPHYSYYKPSGVYFEACSAGRLLLIEPDEANFERPEIAGQVTAKTGDIPHSAKRWRFVAMNAIAEEIAGVVPSMGQKGKRMR